MDIHELRAQYRSTLDEMEALNELTETESRDFTDAEQSQYTELEQRADSLNARIERLQKFRERRDNAPEPAQSEVREQPKVEARDYDTTDFRNFGDFVKAVRFNPSDQRLRGQAVEDRADLEMGVDAQGGYLVPDQFRDEILQIGPRDAIIRPRARVLPGGTSPDGKLTIPALDQSGTHGVYSGVTVSWIAEGAEKPETNPVFTDIELEPYELAAHTVFTDKLLRNAPVVDTMVRDLFRGAIAAAEDVAFLSGDGDGKPTGIIGHASAVTVNRETANEVSFADLVAMRAAFLANGGQPYFLASQGVLPALMTIENGAGYPMWQDNAREGSPGTLLGIPVVVSNRMPALGSEGDVVLADLSYYLIKDGAPLAIATSEHVRFLENKTVMKVFTTVDGKPWMASPLQDEDGTSISPFVVLDTPAG